MNQKVNSSRLILGTGASACKDYDRLYNVVKTAINNGIVSFDTAPSYHTEEMLGLIIKECINESDCKREDLHIQTKVDAWQMKDGSIQKHIQSALNKMDIFYFDAVLIHWPIPQYFETSWRSLVELKEKGKIVKIGVCNVRTRHITKLLENIYKPDIIQIERNPLRTCLKEEELCKNYCIEMQAYSPLCKMDKRIKENKDLKEISLRNQKNVGQIILRWQLQSGYSPIFTSTKPARVKEYAEIFDFRLEQSEIEIINKLNINYKMYLESCTCPGF